MLQKLFFKKMMIIIIRFSDYLFDHKFSPSLAVLDQSMPESGFTVTYVRKEKKIAQIQRDPGLMISDLTFWCPAGRQKFAVLSYSPKYPVQLRDGVRHLAVGFTRAKCQEEGCRENAEIRDVSEVAYLLSLSDLCACEREGLPS